jgi:hypothetical protein
MAKRPSIYLFHSISPKLHVVEKRGKAKDVSLGETTPGTLVILVLSV